MFIMDPQLANMLWDLTLHPELNKLLKIVLFKYLKTIYK